MIKQVMELLKLPAGFADYWVVGVALREGVVSVASASTASASAARYSLRVAPLSPLTEDAISAFVARHAPHWAGSHVRRVTDQMRAAISTAVMRNEPTALGIATVGRTPTGAPIHHLPPALESLLDVVARAAWDGGTRVGAGLP